MPAWKQKTFFQMTVADSRSVETFNLKQKTNFFILYIEISKDKNIYVAVF